ncbi:hypothetical protein AVEN_31678-1 [Araneus ventricosus]|uniref:Uncharacterized protein n=1 Tax=Araneus ventricosus TaxID=182803 RepID=A0A4Y2SEA0_ARAVE|nr:hypothetical protein AVEN_31678-1 [Araneus ventricosus]
MLTAKVTSLARQQNKQQLCYSYSRPGHIARFCIRKYSSRTNQSPEYREMILSFRYGQNSHPSNYPNVLPPPPDQFLCPSYPDFESIQQQLVLTLIKEEVYQQPVTNITKKAFSGFEETLQSDIEHTCARNQEKTDISAELVLTEERDRTLKAEISVREREASPLLKSGCSAENRSENKRDQESHSIFERGHDFDTGRGNFGSSSSLRDSYPSLGSPSISDDVEIWNKHIEGKTIERAKKCRAEEVKHCEQNRRFDHKNSKSFEKCNKANDMDIDNANKSQRNSESRVDKYPNRNNRRRDSNIGDRSPSQHTQFPFSRPFRQNVPLRFQEQQIEFCRQKSQRTDYNRALKLLSKFLSIEPTNRQAQELQKYVKEKMRHEGLMGMAIVGGAALAIGSVVGIGMALARKN